MRAPRAYGAEPVILPAPLPTYRLSFWPSDGGRAAAGYRGTAGDCVTRAIAIATGKQYADVYRDLAEASGRSPRDGVKRKVYERYLTALGWRWVATMQVGSGCRVHMRRDELPAGRLIVRLSKHLAAVIDGTVYDLDDPSRNGTRCVYGYYLPPEDSRSA